MAIKDSELQKLGAKLVTTRAGTSTESKRNSVPRKMDEWIGYRENGKRKWKGKELSKAVGGVTRADVLYSGRKLHTGSVQLADDAWETELKFWGRIKKSVNDGDWDKEIEKIAKETAEKAKKRAM